MAKPGDGAGFLFEAPGIGRILGDTGIDHFNGDLAIEIRINGLVDLRHPTFSKQRFHNVIAQLLTDEGIVLKNHCVLPTPLLGGWHLCITDAVSDLADGDRRPVPEHAKSTGTGPEIGILRPRRREVGVWATPVRALRISYVRKADLHAATGLIVQ